MSDFEDDDEYGSDDGYGWIYVEDHYDEIDDMVEHTCPSPMILPGPESTQDYDPYAYFEDLQYLSDAYYDNCSKTVDPSKFSAKKRKREAPRAAHSPTKKLKTGSGAKNGPSRTRNHRPPAMSPHICWIAHADQDREDTAALLSRKAEQTLERFRLLPYWEQLQNKQPTSKTSKKASVVSDAADEQAGEIADGVDADQLRQVAELLQGDALEDLKKQLAQQGIDPEYLDMALQDMLEGRERQFEDDDHAVGSEDVNALNAAPASTDTASSSKGSKIREATGSVRYATLDRVEHPDKTEQPSQKSSTSKKDVASTANCESSKQTPQPVLRQSKRPRTQNPGETTEQVPGNKRAKTRGARQPTLEKAASSG